MRRDGARRARFGRGSEGAAGRDAGHERERTREKGSVRGAGAFRQAGGRERDEAKFFSESLILAQNERWQRGLGMQVGRDPEGSNIGR